MKTVSSLDGSRGAKFSVGDRLPDNTYTLPAVGAVALIVNDKIPHSVFILIKDHAIIEIIDARNSDTINVLKFENEDYRFDAVGMSEFDFRVQAAASKAGMDTGMTLALIPGIMDETVH